jgi:polysaccharide pyruvyl transferase WcaK-like protein
MALTGKRRTRVVLLGWYGSNNTGDEALAQVITDELRRRGFTDLVALSTDPERTSARLGIESRPRTLFHPATLASLRSASALILGGGGLLQDGTSVYNLPVYAAYALVARLLGVRVIGWGLGAEPLHTLLGRLLVRLIVHSSSYFSVRDEVSLRLLERAGVDPCRVTVTVDPAVLLAEHTPEGRQPEGKRPIVMLCLRHLPVIRPGLNLAYLLPVSVRLRFGLEWKQEPGRVEGLIESASRAVKVAVEELGAYVVLLPLWANRDEEVLELVANEAQRMGVPAERILRAQPQPGPAELAGYVAEADVLVSMRLHALVFGMTRAVPSVALSYARKVRGFMHAMDSERWTVEVERRTPAPDEVAAKIRLLWPTREAERMRLTEQAASVRAIAARDADAIAAVLRGEQAA